jgi:hypothetical protein
VGKFFIAFHALSRGDESPTPFLPRQGDLSPKTAKMVPGEKMGMETEIYIPQRLRDVAPSGAHPHSFRCRVRHLLKASPRGKAVKNYLMANSFGGTFNGEAGNRISDQGDSIHISTDRV